MKTDSGNVPRKKTRFALSLFRILAAVYVILCVGCASWQRRLIYFPPHYPAAAVDATAGRLKLERWNNKAGAAIGWKRLSPVQPAAGQVLIAHGNACCAFEEARFADALQAAAPLDIYMIEYPGYGDQPGEPSEQSLYKAAEEGFQTLPTNAPTYLLGESLGTGVACYLAGKHPTQVSSVVLLAPYNNLADVGQAHMKILPVHLLLRDRFPSEEHLKNFHGSLAVFVGGRDTVVPQKFGRRLFDGYSGPKKLWEIAEADHGSVMDQPTDVWRQVIGFCRSNRL